jgi:DNA-binding response OmpR family regulator
MPHILLVDDDPALLRLTTVFLNQAGYEVSSAVDGIKAISMVKQNTPDLILLDVMMPNIDGFEICQRIREITDVPIMFLSARSQVNDKVTGLKIGADDYLSKPYELQELLARIEALLRRSQSDKGQGGGTIQMSGFTLDPLAHKVLRPDSQERELTPVEFRLFYYLMQNAGRTLSSTELLNHVWGYADDVGNLVAVTVRRLRGKIEPDPENPRWIITVRKVGYKFEAEA